MNIAEIKVIDGSKRSNHSNAYVTGWGKFRKVVLFDTLIERLDRDEILAIVNHELGHVHKNHIIKQVCMTSFTLTVMFSCFSLVLYNPGIIASFGFLDVNVSNFLYLFIFLKLYLPISFITGFIEKKLTRTAEYQADEFATRNGHGVNLKKGLVSLYKQNKGHLVSDPLFSAMTYSHPTLVERLHAIDEILEEMG